MTWWGRWRDPTRQSSREIEKTSKPLSHVQERGKGSTDINTKIYNISQDNSPPKWNLFSKAKRRPGAAKAMPVQRRIDSSLMIALKWVEDVLLLVPLGCEKKIKRTERWDNDKRRGHAVMTSRLWVSPFVVAASLLRVRAWFWNKNKKTIQRKIKHIQLRIHFKTKAILGFWIDRQEPVSRLLQMWCASVKRCRCRCRSRSYHPHTATIP